MNEMEKMITKAKELPDGESAVGIFYIDGGSWIVIADGTSEQKMVLTSAETDELHKLLSRRARRRKNGQDMEQGRAKRA